ncbi:unnamed protein product, partial [Phaeothamnion confervicola]
RPTRGERLVIAWAMIRGLGAIFVEGTFVIFNTYIEDHASIWPTGLWVAWGKVDARYVTSDPYVTTMEATTALFLGPALLLYAWAAYTRRRFRHIAGIGLSSCLLALVVCFVGTEVHAGFSNTAKVASPAAFWLGWVPVAVGRFAVPLLVLSFNVRHIYRRVAVAE